MGSRPPTVSFWQPQYVSVPIGEWHYHPHPPSREVTSREPSRVDERDRATGKDAAVPQAVWSAGVRRAWEAQAYHLPAPTIVRAPAGVGYVIPHYTATAHWAWSPVQPWAASAACSPAATQPPKNREVPKENVPPSLQPSTAQKDLFANTAPAAPNRVVGTKRRWNAEPSPLQTPAESTPPMLQIPLSIDELKDIKRTLVHKAEQSRRRRGASLYGLSAEVDELRALSKRLVCGVPLLVSKQAALQKETAIKRAETQALRVEAAALRHRLACKRAGNNSQRLAQPNRRDVSLPPACGGIVSHRIAHKRSEKNSRRPAQPAHPDVAVTPASGGIVEGRLAYKRTGNDSNRSAQSTYPDLTPPLPARGSLDHRLAYKRVENGSREPAQPVAPDVAVPPDRGGSTVAPRPWRQRPVKKRIPIPNGFHNLMNDV